MIRDESYIHIGGWMLNNLKLKGNELLVYATIYSFTNGTDEHCYKGSASYLSERCGLQRRQIMNILKSLEEKGYIMRKDRMENGIKFVDYYTPYAKIAQGGYANIAHQNNRIDNNSNNPIKTPLPKQNLELKLANICNGDLTFENIYNLFYHKSGHKPSIDKCRKVFESLNLDKEGYNMLVKDLKLFRIEYKYGIKDQMYRPGFEKYVGGFNAEGVNEEYRLKTIIKFHMDNTDDKEKMKKRYADLCETFGKDEVDALVKAYGRAKNKITLNIN